MREDRFKRLVDNVCDHGGTQVIPVIPGIRNLHRFVQNRGMPDHGTSGLEWGFSNFSGKLFWSGHTSCLGPTPKWAWRYIGENATRKGLSGLSPKIWDRFQVLTFPICPEPWPAGLSMDCAENLANFEKRYQTAWHCWDPYCGLINVIINFNSSSILPEMGHSYRSALEAFIFASAKHQHIINTINLIFFGDGLTHPPWLFKRQARQRRWDLYSQWDENVAHRLAKQAGWSIGPDQARLSHLARHLSP